MESWNRIKGTVVRGHGVASGIAHDPRFPDGTLSLQLPLFEKAGVELSGFHRATVNVSIAPLKFEPRRAKITVRGVRWHEDTPPEDFSFFSCRITTAGDSTVDGLLYYPHPETKPEHFQDESVLEVLAPFLEGIAYGAEVALDLLEDQIAVH